MSNDSSQSIGAGFVAVGLAIGGVDSASTGAARASLAAITASGAAVPIGTSAQTLQGLQASGAAFSGPIPHVEYIVASGTGVTGVRGDSTVVLPLFGASGHSYPTGASSQSLGFVASSIGLEGSRGTSIAITGAWLAAGSAAALAVGSSSLSVPLWAASGYGYLGTGASFSAVVVHTQTEAIWTYSNYRFNSFARVNGVLMGAGDAGLFKLTGTNDDGVSIASSARMAATDFNTPRQKYVDRVYVGYRTSGNLILRVRTDEVNIRDYRLPGNNISGLHGAHVRIGRGLRARYWQFEILNEAGATFDFNMIECRPTGLQRRVGGSDA